MYIQDISKTSKFWVVRSGDGGMFYDHFIHNSIIAIGHIDSMDYDNNTLKSSDSVETLVYKYKNTLLEKKETLASASNKAGQVNRFITDMAIGDVVITLDAKRIIVGVIKSETYKKNDSVTLKNVDGSTSELMLKFTLRRDVDWGKTQMRNKLSLAINNSFRANQTVFSANEHWKELNHWLSVAFISDGEAYISSRIEQKDGINNLDIAQYSIIINKIEAIAETLAYNDTDEFSDDDLLALFEENYKELRKNRSFTVTTQQVFLSPGDLWAKTSGDRLKSLLVISTFLLMFNIEPSFANENDKQFIDSNRDSISLLLEKVKSDESFTEVQQGLDLHVPHQKISKNTEREASTNNGSDVEPDDFEGM
ncbi:hypothetical protein [Pantoea sp. SOD02]|uniref:hypothetical protein n=1 Tax=Pantoea sp. SOD02 TaxID=2970818 RepID=UPI002157A153|nr:hypothetical protein [Pantoea sp. SOD02]UVC28434.1 hypothetical protein NR302_14365 [Pantoea sp. SOD02]